jgi:hypothetical protein
MLGFGHAVQHLKAREIGGNNSENLGRIARVRFVAPIAIIDGPDGQRGQGLDPHATATLVCNQFNFVFIV